MASDPVSNYLKAFREAGEARRRAMVYVDVIRDAARKLEREWRQVSVTDIGVQFGIGQDLRVNGGSWPNAQELAEALAGYREAVFAAGRAYREIPEAQRGMVARPPVNRYG